LKVKPPFGWDKGRQNSTHAASGWQASLARAPSLTPSGAPLRGRLILHSTHISGLIPVLDQMYIVDGIQTITPASWSSETKPHFKIKESFCTHFQEGSGAASPPVKCAEVFVLTTLSQESLSANKP